MSITRVNTASFHIDTSGGTFTIPGGTGIQAGDLIVACCVSNGTHVANGMTVSDSVNGVNYTALLEQDESSASSFFQDTKWLVTPVNIADGATFTFTGFAGATAAGCAIDIFRGCSGSIDQAAVGVSPAASASFPATPGLPLGANAAAGALVLSLAAGGGAFTLTQSDAAFTAGSVSTANRCCGIAYVLSASGSSAYASVSQWTQGTSSSCAAQKVSFAAAQQASQQQAAQPGGDAFRQRYRRRQQPQSPVPAAVPVSGADSAGGAEAAFAQAALSGADSAAAAESGSVQAAVPGADSGTAAEAAGVQAAASPQAAAQRGGPAWRRRYDRRQQPQLPAAVPPVPVSSADAAQGADAVRAAGPSSGDTVLAVESAFYSRAGADAGSAAEGARMAVSAADSARAADRALTAWPGSADVSGAGDAPRSAGLNPSADAAHAAEAVRPFPFSSADSAQGADAVHEIGIWAYPPVNVRLLAPYRHDPAAEARLEAAVARLAGQRGWARVTRLVRSGDTARCAERGVADGR